MRAYSIVNQKIRQDKKSRQKKSFKVVNSILLDNSALCFHFYFITLFILIPIWHGFLKKMEKIFVVPEISQN